VADGSGGRLTVRPMTPEDFGSYNAVDHEAFGAWAEASSGTRRQWPPRRHDLLRLYLGSAPGASLVACQGDTVVGGLFAHLWGRIGWIGPLAVAPPWQGAGVGRRLLEAAVNRLRAADCTVIGLETMPHSSYNVGLYTRLGFQPAGTRLSLYRRLEPGSAGADAGRRAAVTTTGPKGPDVRLIDAAGLEPLLPEISRLSGRIQAGLDLAPAATDIQRRRLGAVLVARQRAEEAGRGGGDAGGKGPDRPVLGLAVILHQMREGEGGGGHIWLLAVDPASSADEAVFEALVAAAEQYLRRTGRALARASVYGRYWRALQALLARGYRVESTGLRLVHGPLAPEAYILDPRSFLLARWSG